MNCAMKAREAGYDGVEKMGSEGYFINQFLSQATNLRTDAWGGDYSHRMRLPVEILARMREAVGPDFIIIYRLSMIDLVPAAAPGTRSSPWARRWPRAGRTSSTPASAGTRRVCPPLPPACRVRRLPGSRKR